MPSFVHRVLLSCDLLTMFMYADVRTLRRLIMMTGRTQQVIEV